MRIVYIAPRIQHAPVMRHNCTVKLYDVVVCDSHFVLEAMQDSWSEVHIFQFLWSGTNEAQREGMLCLVWYTSWAHTFYETFLATKSWEL